jgi:hypothetical protein
VSAHESVVPATFNYFCLAAMCKTPPTATGDGFTGGIRSLPLGHDQSYRTMIEHREIMIRHLANKYDRDPRLSWLA